MLPMSVVCRQSSVHSSPMMPFSSLWLRRGRRPLRRRMRVTVSMGACIRKPKGTDNSSALLSGFPAPSDVTLSPYGDQS